MVAYRDVPQPARPGARACGPAAELSELGLAQFALYLMHDRKESTVLSAVY
ncbi:hypothetical protein [Nonomuraea polychroma]|uniref:hypothetical protein n=1 Tax=Nonomuraea polychroma TaxID=46176 RepID=UPI0013E2D6FC|nr:hypothetical protein [Nonomuraea polychroma]